MCRPGMRYGFSESVGCILNEVRRVGMKSWERVCNELGERTVSSRCEEDDSMKTKTCQCGHRMLALLFQDDIRSKTLTLPFSFPPLSFPAHGVPSVAHRSAQSSAKQIPPALHSPKCVHASFVPSSLLRDPITTLPIHLPAYSSSLHLRGKPQRRIFRRAFPLPKK